MSWTQSASREARAPAARACTTPWSTSSCRRLMAWSSWTTSWSLVSPIFTSFIKGYDLESRGTLHTQVKSNSIEMHEHTETCTTLQYAGINHLWNACKSLLWNGPQIVKPPIMIILCAHVLCWMTFYVPWWLKCCFRALWWAALTTTINSTQKGDSRLHTKQHWSCPEGFWWSNTLPSHLCWFFLKWIPNFLNSIQAQNEKLRNNHPHLGTYLLSHLKPPLLSLMWSVCQFKCSKSDMPGSLTAPICHKLLSLTWWSFDEEVCSHVIWSLTQFTSIKLLFQPAGSA